jgi:hypothetical protein
MWRKIRYWRKDGWEKGSDGRRERSRKQLLHDFKEKRVYCELKEEAPDRTVLKICFEKRYGRFVRRTAD